MPPSGSTDPTLTQPVPSNIYGLAPAVRRKVVLLGVLRALTYTTLLVALYYALPLGTLHNVASALLLAGLFIGVVILLAWQYRAILRAPYPGIQAVQALSTVIPLFLLLFATTYYLIERAAPGSFTQGLDRTEALYFTVTTFSTVGFGDITPKTDGARIVVMIQMLANLAVIGFGVRVLFSAVQTRREGARQQLGQDGPDANRFTPSGAGEPSGGVGQSRRA